MSYPSEQTIEQLPPRKGAYFYLEIPATFVESLPRQRNTRLICTLEKQLSFACGLNHLGNGNYFVILSKKNLAAIAKSLGEQVYVNLEEDPNPLGVAIPEFLEVLMQQDGRIHRKFQQLTDGKKRGIIHQLNRIKNIDLQIERAQQWIEEAG